MGREPSWQEPGEREWRLPPYRWRTAIGASIAEIPRPLRHAALWVSNARTRRLLGRVDDLRLALGSGSTVPDGWYGLDLRRRGPRVRRADLLLGIPAATGTVAAVLAEHFFEHLYLDDVPGMLAECRRVLRAGGVIRVVSPDARQVARLLQLGPAAESDPMVVADSVVHRWNDDGFRWARYINRMSHQWGQHRSLLTPDMVIRMLSAAGFDGIEALPADKTRYFMGCVPDVHPIRFPDEVPEANFAVEAQAP
ncbi:class I SAM-dependent methyltransferase [Phytohabitans sp. LJ34]|uniref:class I SAM-dependent methyltransferase n=1 Tax=Phytohabitans sp. LJ34 TaxID=3452217 RepID=UPI003F8CD850